MSLLLGLGYNAFVASGYASREQTLGDQTKFNCPYLSQNEELKTSSPKLSTSKYRPKSPPDFRSKFIEEMQVQKRKKIENELAKYEENHQRMIAVSCASISIYQINIGFN